VPSDAAQDAKVAALEKGRAALSYASPLPTPTAWNRSFSAGKIATAVAGSILGINAFNQPDVEASKIVTKQLTSEYESKGSLPAEKPILAEAGFKLFTDEKKRRRSHEDRWF